MARPRLHPLPPPRPANQHPVHGDRGPDAGRSCRCRAADVPQYLRRRGLRRPAPGHHRAGVAPEIRVELNKIGVNLNQIVRLAHQGRYRPRGGLAVVEQMERLAAWIETALDPGERE